MRLITYAAWVLVLGARLHHSGFDYAGLAAASAASWIGLPGPGEPVLIAAGVLAARHRLDLGSVLVTAWVAATAGGIVGWLIGMKAGRAVLSAPGPLRSLRLSALERGDDIFRRVAPLAILLAPSWIAGIHRVRAPLYLTVNALGAALWAVGIGLGAYFAGPVVVDLVDDVGVAATIVVVAVVVAAVILEILRRRRRRRAHPRG
jgi:membrane protein DedA with SNARE-associated domain